MNLAGTPFQVHDSGEQWKDFMRRPIAPRWSDYIACERLLNEPTMACLLENQSSPVFTA